MSGGGGWGPATDGCKKKPALADAPYFDTLYNLLFKWRAMDERPVKVAGVELEVWKDSVTGGENGRWPPTNMLADPGPFVKTPC